MEKEIILLAKSTKIGNYCMAGIDAVTGEWVRIVSENVAVQHAVSQQEMLCECGHIPEVFDRLAIPIKEHFSCPHQPENYVLDNRRRWRVLGQTTLEDVTGVRAPEDQEYIFYNAAKRVDPDVIQSVPVSERRSLMMVSPEFPKIQVKQWKGKTHKTITASFRYKGSWYNYINITDPVVLREFNEREEGAYKVINEVLFVMSLADVHSDDGEHYKLIATVLGELNVMQVE